VTRNILWQATLALVGIALVFLVIFQLASTTSPEVITVEVRAPGGSYVEGVLGFWDSLNPIYSAPMVADNPIDQDLSTLVFDGLTERDETGRLAPALARGWTVSEDGTQYEFSLREDVLWQDGAPFTSADVAFTIQAIQDPGYQGDTSLADLWRNVTVEPLGEYTVRFTLVEPFPSFLQYTVIGMLPAHLLSAVAAADLPDHEFTTSNPVGTGMFRVEEVSADRIVLVANPGYWGTRPYLERLEFWFYSEWDGLLEDYRQGAIQGLHPPGLEELTELEGLPGLQFYSAQSAGYALVYLNLMDDTLPFFEQKEVRQALLYALDRQGVVDQVLGGHGLVADSPILPNTWAYDSGVRPYAYDPERAIGLLDAAGWADTDGDLIRDQEGVELAFTLLTTDDPLMLAMADRMVQQWRAVGIDATIRPVSTEAAIHFVRGRDFEAALVEIELTSDPDPYPLWHSTQAESGQNFAGFASEEADLVMEEARRTVDPARRLELYSDFQRVFAEEVPSLLIHYPIYVYAVDSQVHGVQLSPMLHTSDRFRNIHEWFYVQTEEMAVGGNDGLDKPGE